MKIAFFGGSFDPPHRGHIAVARTAIARLALDRVLFAPVAVQPLKDDGAESSYEDRLAMVRIAVQGDSRLIASRADAPRADGKPNYTIDTLAEVRQALSPGDLLFCLVGVDAMLSFPRWHRADELLLFCDFIVASRPGFSLDQISEALPQGIESSSIKPGGQRAQPELRDFIRIDLEGRAGLAGRRSALYLLPDLEEDISATEIRAELAGSGGVGAQAVLAPGVAEYIRAHHLYRHCAKPA